MVVTRWKMTREEAAECYAGQQYEIIEATREERIVSGDPFRNSMVHFSNGSKR
jgi:hypothetical protein